MARSRLQKAGSGFQNVHLRTLAWPQRVPVWLAALLVGGLALVPRCLGLADFTTIDESYHWWGRVERFSEALRAGDWIKTNQTGHPGVTVMWLGGLGRWLAGLVGVQDPGWAGGGVMYQAMLRLPLAVTNGLAVVLGYLLLRRVLRSGVALLAALLWATSPFLIAHSRLLHMDALLTSFMTLSVLALLQIADGRLQISGRKKEEGRRKKVGGSGVIVHPFGYAQDRRPSSIVHRQSSVVHRPLPWLVLSGVFAGLALLTKGPSLILLPAAGLLLVGLQMADGRWQIVRLIGHYALWLGVAAAVFVAAWPAIWVAPVQTFGSVINEVLANGGEPHHSGNYFLGQPVADPGLLFYPAVVLWRTTPLTLLGLVLYFGFTIYDLRLWRKSEVRSQKSGGRSQESEVRNQESEDLKHQASSITCQSSFVVRPSSIVYLSLLFFAVFFTLAMSIGPKKFDRYLLPIWPSLEILAAAGLVRIADCSRVLSEAKGSQIADGKFHRQSITEKQSLVVLHRRLSIVYRLGLAGVGVFLAATLFWYHPYYLGYFNPLLGGGRTGQYVMLAGWGEGMEQVGAWLQARPDLRTGQVLSWIYPTLAPFVPREVPVKDLRTPRLHERTSYVVLYSRSVQRKENAEAEAYVRQFPPLYRLEAHGIEYATVHQVPRPFTEPVSAVFGEGLHLRGFSNSYLGNTLTITPSWSIEADQPGGRFVFVHVLDEQGQTVAQVDAPLDQGMFATWQAGQQFDSPLPLQLPADGLAARYRVVLGVYDPATGARLPITRGVALPAQVDGPQVIELSRAFAP